MASPPASAALALTLIPPAAWATGTLEMFTRIVNAVVDWITDFVFSPLELGRHRPRRPRGRAVRRRRDGALAQLGRTRRARSSVGGDGAARRKPLPPGRKARSEPVIDPELAEIEALLKKRGIT